MTVVWQPATREWHLGNGRTSWVLAILENGWIGQLHAGVPLEHGRSYRHLAGPAFDGFDNRLGDSVALALPVPGLGGDAVGHGESAPSPVHAQTSRGLAPGAIKG